MAEPQARALVERILILRERPVELTKLVRDFDDMDEYLEARSAMAKTARRWLRPFSRAMHRVGRSDVVRKTNELVTRTTDQGSEWSIPVRTAESRLLRRGYTKEELRPERIDQTKRARAEALGLDLPPAPGDYIAHVLAERDVVDAHLTQTRERFFVRMRTLVPDELHPATRRFVDDLPTEPGLTAITNHIIFQDSLLEKAYAAEAQNRPRSPFSLGRGRSNGIAP